MWTHSHLFISFFRRIWKIPAALPPLRNLFFTSSPSSYTEITTTLTCCNINNYYDQCTIYNDLSYFLIRLYNNNKIWCLPNTQVVNWRRRERKKVSVRWEVKSMKISINVKWKYSQEFFLLLFNDVERKWKYFIKKKSSHNIWWKIELNKTIKYHKVMNT